MSIEIRNNQFHLKTKNTSYIFSLYRERYLTHLYWGKRLDYTEDLTHFTDEPICSRANALHVPIDETNSMFVSDLQLEFSVFGGGDYRAPTVMACDFENCTVSEFAFCGSSVTDGKPSLDGLPASYSGEDDVKTLQMEFIDKKTRLKAVLSYSVFYEYDVIARSIRYENTGRHTVSLVSAQSATVDFYGRDYSVLNLHGDWLRERYPEWRRVGCDTVAIESRRGMSSHMNNPFTMLAKGEPSEEYGDVFGFMLVYSGNFNISAEGNSCGGTRVNIGINPFNFNWELKAGESFQTPEALLGFSDCGTGGASRLFHRLIRERVCRGSFRDELRPMVINNWEGTGPDFDEEKLLAIAENGKKLGLEMFVLDDGWFGNRRNGGSLGDWYVNEELLPGGLKSLSEKINAMGMKFGIWVEPEMISPDSDLYRAHPDWCIHSEGRRRTLNREQLVLDLSRKEIRDYVVDAVCSVLDSGNISYVKWDCNRNIGETENRMQSHKFVLGLYEILERITSKYPNILFESCSSGGGRFDAGMLYYMPQTWTSDNTEPISRIKIQYGTSFAYPAITMTAHVGRTEVGMEKYNPILNTAATVAMSGNFGYEMDLSLLSAAEIKQAREHVELYKKIRATVQFGNLYRLESPFKGDFASCMYTDDRRAVLFVYQLCKQSNGEERRILLRGLKKDAVYVCRGRKYSGEELMQLGIRIPLNEYMFFSDCYIFEKTVK